jgi:hypothetical protein
VLDTSAADPKTIRNRNLHPPLHASPIAESDSDLNFESESDTDSDSYSDPDTELDIGTNPNVELDTDLDSEAEEILKDIAKAKEEGPAQPRHKPQTVRLWKSEGKLWVK